MTEDINDVRESRGFKIVVFIMTALVVGISIANVVFYNRLRSGTSTEITGGEATTMFWINLIILIAAGVIFIWSLWKLIFSRSTRHQVKHYFVSPTAVSPAGYTRTITSTSPMLSDTSAAADIVTPSVIQSDKDISNPGYN